MHALLEAYLSEVAARLKGLPAERRDEEMWEMRAHLLSCVEAYEELGKTEQEAVESTLRQFGPSPRVASGLTRAWRRGHGSWREAVKAGLFGAAALWGVNGLCKSWGLYMMGHPQLFHTLGAYFGLISYVLLFGLPAMLGGFLGGYSRRGAVKGAVWGAGLCYVVPMVVYVAIHVWNDSDILPMSLIFLLQAACLTGTAWAGSRWRNARAGRARLARQ